MTSTTVSHGFIQANEMMRAQSEGRLRSMVVAAGLRGIGAYGDLSVYGIQGCSISCCGEGHSLPDALRDALEECIGAQIRRQGGPVTYTVEVSSRRVMEMGVGMGNWLALRRIVGGPLALDIGRALGIVTHAEWRTPHLRLMGIDLDRRLSVYEYHGECRRG